MDKKEGFEHYKKYNERKLIALIAVFVIGIFLGSALSGVPSMSGFAITGSKLTECNDQIDNDGDNRIDYPRDPGCRNKKDSSEINSNVQCDDGIDNDGDTKRDFNDGGCSGLSDKSERGTIYCDDGKDNDHDGKIDYPNDPGCASETDADESTGMQCDDGKDNDDSDSLADYPNDPGCESVIDASEADGDCDDNLDNDADGLKDYLYDSECTSYSGQEGSCRDSDNGMVYGIKGIASAIAGKVPYSTADTCTSSVILTEYYCDQNGQLTSSNYDCAGSNKLCVNGACV